MGKIMGKLKHHYNAFPELQTKFFSKTCVIWSLSTKFKKFHHIFDIFKISGTSKHKEKTYNNWCLTLFFSNHNVTSPKLVYSFIKTSGSVMHEKFQLISI